MGYTTIANLCATCKYTGEDIRPARLGVESTYPLSAGIESLTKPQAWCAMNTRRLTKPGSIGNSERRSKIRSNSCTTLLLLFRLYMPSRQLYKPRRRPIIAHTSVSRYEGP